MTFDYLILTVNWSDTFADVENTDLGTCVHWILSLLQDLTENGSVLNQPRLEYSLSSLKANELLA